MVKTNEITVLAVPPGELIAKWDVIEPMITTALPVTIGRFLPIDILAMTIAGGAQGWFVRDGEKILAVLITRLDIYPRRRCLSIFALAGSNMDTWFERANDVITQYARQMGADHMEVQGRQGWGRVLDLTPRSTFLVKDLIPMNDERGSVI